MLRVRLVGLQSSTLKIKQLKSAKQFRLLHEGHRSCNELSCGSGKLTKNIERNKLKSYSQEILQYECLWM